ncbi:hypothetical protein [Limnoglobus roseus]|uniref:Glutaredoxin n=1 Tax=Limnoglobus roseus TaxID=2598579 RepID=A0A5C1AMF8_9BACT|nr:hypothetical protein [Limnoglobus roseus]QEL19245.1 hypothetical protein PX52LOC_06307 [Limnoglobus roseus]QEL20431.1 hypothetical protein PX52LOC_07527 [Limnoglobus roseus]
MTNITIYRCPHCPFTRGLARSVAATFRYRPGTRVEVLNGIEGEFQVFRNDRNVFFLSGTRLPTVREVVSHVDECACVGA